MVAGKKLNPRLFLCACPGGGGPCKIAGVTKVVMLSESPWVTEAPAARIQS